MTFLAATVLVPSLLVALAAGAGFLVERLSGRRVPGTLLLPLGLAFMVSLVALPIARSSLAPAGPWLALAAGVAGWLVGGPARPGATGWRGRLVRPVDPRDLRPHLWPVLAGLGVYVFTLAPVLAAGRVTLPGYLLDGTVGIHLIGADQLLRDGRDFSALAVSSSSEALRGYFGTGYPAGAHALLGSLGRWTGLDPIWSYQPLLSVFLAMSALGICGILQRLGLSARAAAAGALVATAPALVYSYALMGAIKEIGLLPFLLLLTALTLEYPDVATRRAREAVVPLAVAVGACVSVVGLSAAGWVGLLLAICLATAVSLVRRGRLRWAGLGRQVAVLAGVVVVLALPTVLSLGTALTLASSLSQTNEIAANDPGNLLRPLRPEQLFGAWLGPDHRVDPPHPFATLMLDGAVALAAAVGVALLVAARRWVGLAVVAAWLLALWALTRRGTIWIDAKLLVLTSPIVLAMACAGAAGLRRAAGVVVAGALALAVGWSATELYRGTNLAPTARLAELREIGEEFAGQGGAYVADFDEVGLYLLRRLDPEGPGYAHRTERTVFLAGQGLPRYGGSYDFDRIDWAQLKQLPIIVQRRSPFYSQPPGGYERAHEGRSYEVFRRTAAVERVRDRYPISTDAGPSAPADCERVRALSGAAERERLDLVVATSPPALRVDPQRAYRLPVNWRPHPLGGVFTDGVGRLEQRFYLREAGRYRIWLQGDFGRSLEVSIDGRRLGATGRETGGDLNVSGGFDVRLARGTHDLTLLRPSGGFAPGAATASRLVATFVQPLDGRRVQDWPTSRAEQLCGRGDIDWIELRER